MQLDQAGIRKAAVFLSGLDWDTASTILKQLSVDEAKAVRREMVSINKISPDEVNRTVRQFLNDTQSMPSNASMVAKHKSASKKQMQVYSEDGVDSFEFSGMQSGAENTIHSMTQHAVQKNAMPNDDTNAQHIETNETTVSNTEKCDTQHNHSVKRFVYLERISPLQTAAFLAEEAEQIIAVVLPCLTPKYSGDVLACFEQSLKMDVIRRLAQLGATDELILDEIDTMLKERLEREVTFASKQKPGLALLEQILQVVNNEIGNDILAGLNETQGVFDSGNGEYADGLSDVPLLTFDHLTLLEDHEIGMLFRMQSPEIAVKSILHCDDHFVERVLNQFPVYEQLFIREQMRQMEPIPYEETAYAQQCVLQGVVQLIEQGVINDIPVAETPQYIASTPTILDYAA